MLAGLASSIEGRLERNYPRKAALHFRIQSEVVAGRGLGRLGKRNRPITGGMTVAHITGRRSAALLLVRLCKLRIRVSE